MSPHLLGALEEIHGSFDLRGRAEQKADHYVFLSFLEPDLALNTQ